MKMPPRKIGNGKKELNKDDPMYKEKRNKNNDAVKKSRMKTKTKSEETMGKVANLKQVGASLNNRQANQSFLSPCGCQKFKSGTSSVMRTVI